MRGPPPDSWLRVTPLGLWCEPGGFHVDPVRAVARAVVTHGHSDHARPGHGAVLATRETLAIMAQRYRDEPARGRQALAFGEAVRIGEVTLRLLPAGHILGSAQVVLEHGGSRIIVSGDYKRRPDPTCLPFEPAACDAFITEATFGLPVFRHPPDMEEVGKLLASLRRFPERAHLVGVYGLGKCQRLLMLLRQAGYDETVYLHGALLGLCDLYREFGLDLGPTAPAAGRGRDDFKGRLVLAPPSATADRWSRRLPDPVIGMASGWMRVRQRARQRGVELPLVISDHADWDELTATILEVGAPRVWVTHGAEEAIVYWCRRRGIDARALSLLGREGEEEE